MKAQDQEIRAAQTIASGLSEPSAAADVQTGGSLNNDVVSTVRGQSTERRTNDFE